MRILFGKDRISGILADAFSELSVSTAMAEQEQISEHLKPGDFDLFLDLRFDPKLGAVCKEAGIRYCCFALQSPAPELFHPAVFAGDVEVISPDSLLIRKLKKLGVQKAYYDTAALGEECSDEKGPETEALFEMLFCRLDLSDRMYLTGLMDAQRTAPDMDVIYNGMDDRILSRLKQLQLFSERQTDTDFRYLISDCILRQRVRSEEKKIIRNSLEKTEIPKNAEIQRFDMTGIKSLNIMRSGKLLISDGAGLPAGLLPGREYIRYEDREELTRILWHLGVNPARAEEIAQTGKEKTELLYSPGAFVQRILDKAER